MFGCPVVNNYVRLLRFITCFIIIVAVGLLILFVVNAIIRQLAEPKIVGKNLDMHPIATLILLYVGYSLFGLVGLVILPVFALSVSVVLKGDNTTEIG